MAKSSSAERLSERRKRTRKRKKIAAVVTVVLFYVVMLAVYLNYDVIHEYNIVTVEPTCTANGYTQYVCKRCQHDYMADFQDALGHNDTRTEVVQTAAGYNCGVETTTCTRCDKVISQNYLDTTEYALPKLYLTGSTDKLSSGSLKHMEAFYSDGDKSFRSYARLAKSNVVQEGPKHTYTLELYDSNDYLHLQAVDFGWGAQDKYYLFSNITDATQSRNMVSAELWGQIAETRGNAPEKLLQAPNGGASDGFPIMLYFNGEYRGVYQLAIPKAGWTVGLDDRVIAGPQTEAYYYTNEDSDSTNFKKTIDSTDGSWDMRYCSLLPSEWVRRNMNSLIDFMNGNDGASFRIGIGDYLDVDGAIDYILFTYFTGASAHYSQDVQWVTYDGETWTPIPYVLTDTWGIDVLGKSTDHASWLPQITGEGIIDPGCTSLLYKRMLNNFRDEIRDRYFELREGVLSEASLTALFADWAAKVPDGLLQAEKEIWVTTPTDEAHTMEYIQDYIQQRSALLDEIIAEF